MNRPPQAFRARSRAPEASSCALRGKNFAHAAVANPHDFLWSVHGLLEEIHIVATAEVIAAVARVVGVPVSLAYARRELRAFAAYCDAECRLEEERQAAERASQALKELEAVTPSMPASTMAYAEVSAFEVEVLDSACSRKALIRRARAVRNAMRRSLGMPVLAADPLEDPLSRLKRPETNGEGDKCGGITILDDQAERKRRDELALLDALPDDPRWHVA